MLQSLTRWSSLQCLSVCWSYLWRCSSYTGNYKLHLVLLSNLAYMNTNDLIYIICKLALLGRHGMNIYLLSHNYITSVLVLTIFKSISQFMLVRLWYHARIRPWNQPILSNKGYVSYSMKQRGPLAGLEPTLFVYVIVWVLYKLLVNIWLPLQRLHFTNYIMF